MPDPEKASSTRDGGVGAGGEPGSVGADSSHAHEPPENEPPENESPESEPIESEPRTGADAAETRARRGRPTEVDPESIALAALRLFDERGYDSVSMDDVAAAAGTSRRTVFRYFPRKADLVWSGAAEARDRIEDVLSRVDPSASGIDAVRQAYVAGLDFPESDLEVTRMRLLLIHRHPALYEAVHTDLRAQRDALASFFAQREGFAADSLRIQILTDAVAGVAFSALVWWAANGTDGPASAIDGAFDELAAAFGA